MAIVSTNLDVRFSVEESSNCRWLEIGEQIGLYNPTTNIGGWDPTQTHNPSYVYVTNVIITVLTPEDTTFTFDKDSTVSTLDFFPNLYPNPYIIMAEDLNYGAMAKLPDGFYTVTMTYEGVIGSDTYTSSTSCDSFAVCQVSCCAKNLRVKAAKANDCVMCDSATKIKALEVMSTIWLANAAAECGQKNRALKLLNKAKFICTNSNCLGCK